MVHVVEQQHAHALPTNAWFSDAMSPFDVVAELSAALAPAWAVEREVDPAGDQSIIVLSVSEDPTQAAFALFEENGFVQVGTVIGDIWHRRQASPPCQRAVAAIVAACRSGQLSPE